MTKYARAAENGPASQKVHSNQGFKEYGRLAGKFLIWLERIVQRQCHPGIRVFRANRHVRVVPVGVGRGERQLANELRRNRRNRRYRCAG